MTKFNDFQMFFMSNPETSVRALRLLAFAILLIVSLAIPEVALAQPMGGDVGS